uniref:TMF-regulated nuclear protein 1-like n=1 Tax=Pristiophorus japonicus TaxID=55135 RepID=UPI00398EE31A
MQVKHGSTPERETGRPESQCPAHPLSARPELQPRPPTPPPLRPRTPAPPRPPSASAAPSCSPAHSPLVPPQAGVPPTPLRAPPTDAGSAPPTDAGSTPPTGRRRRAAGTVMGKLRDKLSGKGAARPPAAADGTKEEKEQRGPGSEPVSRALAPSNSLEFAEARRRLLELERRQRRVRELEIGLQQLRDILVRAEREAVEHGELVSRIRSRAQQGEVGLTARSQSIKSRLKIRGHRAPLLVAAALGLRGCVPWASK